MAQTQNFDNHVRIVPGFHLVTFGIFAINLIWSIVRVIRFFSAESVVSLLLAAAFLLLFFYARMFAMTVQDRVIRLEMQLRLQQLLPAELRPRIAEFTVGQLIALRFASDEELAGLARTVLDKRLDDRKAIKKMIKNWKPDCVREADLRIFFPGSPTTPVGSGWRLRRHATSWGRRLRQRE